MSRLLHNLDNTGADKGGLGISPELFLSLPVVFVPHCEILLGKMMPVKHVWH